MLTTHTHRRPVATEEVEPTLWEITWITADDNFVSQQLLATGIDSNDLWVHAAIGTNIVLMVPLMRFVSAVRLDAIPEPGSGF
jgi:hypothetical protein